MSRKPMAKIFIAALCSPAFALAQTPANPPQTTAAAATSPAVIGPAKIGWINLEQAILDCDEGKKEFGAISEFAKKKSQDIAALQKELQTLKNQREVQGQKLSQDALDDLDDQISDKETVLQRMQQDAQKDFDNRKARAGNQIGRKMIPIIEKLSREKGLSAVAFLNPQLYAWVDPSLVITEEVVKAYNAAYSAAAPPKKP
jgi:outer membrane protein